MTQREPLRVGVVGGDDLIVRFGDVVAFIGAAGPEAEAGLLAVLRSVAGAPDPAAVLADALAPVVFGIAATTGFAVTSPRPDGLLVLVHGPAVAEIATAGGGYRITGAVGPNWAGDVVGQAASVSVAAADRPTAQPRAGSELWAGVVPGGGFMVLSAGVAVVDFPTSETVVVQPIPEPPVDATVLSMQSAAPVQTSFAPVAAGVLTGADGAAYILDRDYVIGRAPLNDDTVRTAAASPIVVPYDPYVSRVHAYVSVQAGTVTVRDAGSSSGTFIAAPGAQDWTRIGTEATRLDPGWSLRIGEWMVSYQQ